MELLLAIHNGTLDDVVIELDERTAATIILVSGGYPESYEKGKLIEGLDTVEDVIIFHAGTKTEEKRVFSNGGRVMALTAFGTDISDAVAKALKQAENVHFDKMYYRKDIGFDLHS